MTAEELWEESGLSGDYEVWAFGRTPNKLAGLVMSGTKTATCSYPGVDEPRRRADSQAGDYSLIPDYVGDAACIIRTTRVYVETFRGVTVEHAFKEREGDRSLDYWRRIHMEYFADELGAVGLPFDEGSELVCEEFELVYVRVDLAG